MGVMLQMSAPVVDMVYFVRALPVSGGEAEVTDFCVTPGGGFNAMAAARAAGMDVRLGGSLGEGPMASIVRERLNELEIGLGRDPLSGIDQGCCTVLLEPDGERSFVSYPGAEGRMLPDDLARLTLDDVETVLLSGYSLHYPDARDALIEWIKALPARIALVFDPSPVVGYLPPERLAPVLARADWISANAAEAAVVTGITDPEAAARSLAQGRRGALVRRGAEGCLLATSSGVQAIPSLTVDVVDTNGAGDCHIGSFIAELSRFGNPLMAARYASYAAALSTTRFGPATPPTRADVCARLSDSKKEAH
ncbi:ribokinase [Rhodobacterales bacterium]|nr:ribokinase [Rhodobacterales bacterium]